MAEEEKPEEEPIETAQPAETPKKAQKKAKPGKKTARKRQPTAERKREDGVQVSSKTLLYGAATFVVLYLIYTYGISPKPAVGQVNGTQSDETPTNIVVLNDKSCGTDCDLSRLITQLRTVYPNLNIKELDVGSPEGLKFYQDTNTELLPALFFEKSITSSPAYSIISRYLDPAGDYFSMRIGANWDPYCDPTTAHCGEDRCKARIGCRPEVSNDLKIYIMSQCPYGIQAMESMKEVLNAFSGEINFSVGYIGQVDQNGNIVSLHGAAEVDEDLRSMCAQKLYPANYTYLNYVWCRNNDTKGDWTTCANQTGLDAAKIKSCAEDPAGRKYLVDSFIEADTLAIYSSPTFLVNNKRTYNAISAADIQTGICGLNAGLKGCAQTLSNGTAPAGSCG